VRKDDEFVELVAQHQSQLYFYIQALLGDRGHVDDVLQETNVQIWKKSSEYTPGTKFKAWVFRIAHFQVMYFRQKQLRDRLVFCSETIEKLSGEAKEVSDRYDDLTVFLNECLDHLSPHQRNVIMSRYGEERSLSEIGKEIGKTASAVGQLIFRIRKQLLNCVSQKERRALHAS